jgi:hypothetical protein
MAKITFHCSDCRRNVGNWYRRIQEVFPGSEMLPDEILKLSNMYRLFAFFISQQFQRQLSRHV